MQFHKTCAFANIDSLPSAARPKLALVVAPYCPVGSELVNLGTSRKIESMVDILGRIFDHVILVNSAHNSKFRSRATAVETKVGQTTTTIISPPTYCWRPVGKLKNLFEIKRIIRLVFDIGSPEIVWLYNGYAFEMQFASKLKALSRALVLLNFEDWHFARGRGVNPKPAIDYLTWRSNISSVDYAFCVNTVLMDRCKARGVSSSLLPGIISPKTATLADTAPPFVTGLGLTVGYFGGLSEEKGCRIVIDAVTACPNDVHFVVCGSGPLLSEFLSISESNPAALTVYHNLSADDMNKHLGGCDIVLNPHSSSASFRTGVFPSKIVEGIGSGRLVISTGVDSNGMESVLGGVIFYEGGASELLRAIRGSRLYYATNRQLIHYSRERALDLCSEFALSKRLLLLIENNANRAVSSS